MDIEAYIDSGFKRKFIVRFCLGLIAVSLVSTLLFFFVMPGGAAGFYAPFISNFQHAREMLLISLLLIGIFEIVLACLFTILLVLFVSHKVGGPIFKLEQNIERLKNGDLANQDISFRSSDQGKILADKFNEMTQKLNAPFQELKYNFCKFSIGMEKFRRSRLNEGKSGYDTAAVKKVRQHVSKMENILNRFTTP
jgi:hypothetical protein